MEEKYAQDPVLITLQKQNLHKQKMVGGPCVRIGAFRTDRSRIEKAVRNHEILDSKPTEPEHYNWKMRERNAKHQIGPDFRLSHTLQIERVLDTIN